VAVREVKCVKGGSKPADYYIFFYGNGKVSHHLGTDFSQNTSII